MHRISVEDAKIHESEEVVRMRMEEVITGWAELAKKWPFRRRKPKGQGSQAGSKNTPLPTGFDVGMTQPDAPGARSGNRRWLKGTADDPEYVAGLQDLFCRMPTLMGLKMERTGLDLRLQRVSYQLGKDKVPTEAFLERETNYGKSDKRNATPDCIPKKKSHSDTPEGLLATLRASSSSEARVRMGQG
ncbi:unnamed protein product [Discosporangium mesarthrocarpum]